MYAFFQPTPSIVTVDGWRVHEFKCAAMNCKGQGKQPRIVRRYLDTTDRNSTGNLRKHARQCWEEEIILGADTCGDIDSTREGLAKAKKLKDGSVTTAFKRKGKGKVTFLIANMIRPKQGQKLYAGYQKACNLLISSTIGGFKA